MYKINKSIIIFPDPWLAFSPSILNFIQLLEERGSDYQVIAFDNSSFDTLILRKNPNITLINLDLRVYKIFEKLKLIKLLKFILLAVKFKDSAYQDARVIGVDSVGYCVARLFSPGSIYFSLEVERDFFLRAAKKIGITNLIIQSKERAEYLLNGNYSGRIHLLPNSPIISKPAISHSVSKDHPVRIIFVGNIIEAHGVEICIDAIISSSRRCKLILNGPITEKYRSHLKLKYSDNLGKEIFIMSEYILQKDMTEFLSQFDIGIVFYDWNLIGEGNFNYLSCPSGKLFNYFAAGLPIIGSDILGLQSVKDFDAGLLIKRLTSAELSNCIEKIYSRYDEYSENSKRASKYYDFRTHFERITLELF